MKRLLIGSTIGLLAACQAQPPALPLGVSDEQQAALSEIYLSVWHDAHTNDYTKPAIEALLAQQDEDVRGILDDEQWQYYNVELRFDWVTKIHEQARYRPPSRSPGTYSGRGYTPVRTIGDE